MQLEDFSSLKPTEDIQIPLNGAVYYADPAPPTDLVLDAVTGKLSERDVDIAMRAESGAPLDIEEQVAAAKIGMSTTRGVMIFLQEVLRPESLERWTTNMSVQRDDDGKVIVNPQSITLAQCVAVYRALIQAYSGGRPTSPSSPSSNGRGRTGGTSTAGARAKG